MEFVDDRTPREKFTHSCLILGVDTFLSGWGRADGARSYAVWACEPQNKEKVLRWVRNRSDMKTVRVVDSNFKEKDCGMGVKHCHIYVVGDNHPSIN